MATGSIKTEDYAGVPHLKGDSSYNSALSDISKSTRNPACGSMGGFAALFDLQKLKLKLRHPILVSSTDGVGTKLDLARLIGKHDTVGIDLVAMCVNDVLTCGARPVFFLDYFATGKFNREETLAVIRGIADGCRESGCALVGGETAIMPDFYGEGRYDLAGFSVGVVEKSKIIDGRKVKPGDVLLGLASTGFHSNGYSLLRKVFTESELKSDIGRKLLTPTKLYVKSVLDVISKVNVLAVANITGGGFFDNLPRVLPNGLGAQINQKNWKIDPLFWDVMRRANYSDQQMFHTFNMGIGMVLVVRKTDISKAQKVLKKHQVDSWEIGTVNRGGVISVV